MRLVLAKAILAVVAPLLLFILLELGLRVGGFGTSRDFLVPDAERGIYRTNPHFTDLFFPQSFGLKPANVRLSQKKTPGTYRVFVIGESAAMGVPEPAFSLSPQLQAQLRSADSARKFEVFNFGVTGINSHAILRIVQQSVRFDPDLLIVYMGNNEVVGPFGPGSGSIGKVRPRWLIKLGLWVNSTRTGQLVARAVGAMRPAGNAFKEWRGMEMFTREAVEADDPRMAGVYASFAGNLEDMLAIARDAGVKTVLSTVAVNVRESAPFVSRHRATLTASQIDAWNQSSTNAEHANERGNRDQARSLFEDALKIDPDYADTHFQLARLLDKMGDLPAARSHYLAALQRDALRFRADARINEIIRLAAARHASTVSFVDAAKEFGSDAAATSTPAGTNLFYEHVHFRWEGNYALARLLAPAALRALTGNNGASAAWLGEPACADVLGYTDLGHLAMARGMAALTGRPPFSGQSSYAEDRTRLLNEIATLESQLAMPGAAADAVAKIAAALRADPENPLLLFQMASVQAQTGDFAHPLALNDRLNLAVPFSPESAAQRGFILHQLGRNAEAEALLLQAAQSEPYYFQTYSVLAQLWVSTGQTDKALNYFAELVTRMPGGARSLYGELLAQKGAWAEAEQQWRSVLERVPDDDSALEPLLTHLQRSKNLDAALRVMLNAYAYNPRNFKNNSRLAQIYAAKGDSEKAVVYLDALAKSGPVNARLYLELAGHLRKLGRDDAMHLALIKARRTAELAGDQSALQQLEQLIAQPRR